MAQKILGAVGWAGIAVVAAGMVARFVVPERQELWWWALVVGLGLVVVYSLGQWRSVADLFQRRQARYGTLAASGVLLGLAILVAANYILARQNTRWDLTAARQYSLSDQTVRILESLESPIRVLVFAQELDFPRYRDRLGEYEYTSSQVSLELIDPDKNPVLARQYEVQAYGTVVFDYNGRIERVASDQEQDLTNGLIKAVEGEERKAYFLQGHGERSPTGTERDGYSALADALRLDNLSVETVTLAQAGAVPSDAAVLVLAGPSTDLLPAEADMLRAYLDGGGKLLVLLDPPDGPDAENRDNLIGLIADWGIEVGQNIVVDVSGVGQLLGTDATVPVAATYPQHPITDRFALLTAFPLARSVTPVEGGVGGRLASSFAETSPRSWAEINLDLSSGEVAMEEDQGDIPGPISIAAAVAETVEAAADDGGAADDDAGDDSGDGHDHGAEDAEEDESDTPAEARLAVFGDSDFASNGSLGIQGNRDLALNAVNWLAEQENLISIRPREPEDRRITLTADQQFRIFIASLVLIPGVIVGAGVFTWWRRR
ncbi:MAG: Gldg family protein [Acidobacteria bacterium]|nr:Gldg family protein [Acidobacteriota bacterium]